jgi:hypothetical protein
MKTLIIVILSFVLVLLLTEVSDAETQSGKGPSQQSGALTQAAEEFKTLTRDGGMRPGSPPAAQVHHSPRLLWHGRVFENFRNDILDAIPHEVKPNDEHNSPLRRNQFGFNVAGPVLIPDVVENSNTFFVLSYEGVRERISRASLHIVPTVAERRGDFSQTVDQAGNRLPIYDPATTSPNPAYNPSLPVSPSNLQYLRSPFPGNIIPADRLAPIVQQSLVD